MPFNGDAHAWLLDKGKVGVDAEEASHVGSSERCTHPDHLKICLCQSIYAVISLRLTP